jgi:hypothetical protein
MKSDHTTYGIRIERQTDFGRVQVDLSIHLPVGAVVTPKHPMMALQRALQDCLANFIAANKENE